MSSDYHSFDDMYRKHVDEIYRFLFFRVVTAPIAKQPEFITEDLTQQTFVKAFEIYQQNRTDMQWRPWLYKVARSKFVDWLRKKRPEPISPDETGKIDSGMDVERTVQLSIQTSQMYEALRHLEERDQLIIELYVLAQLSAREVALVVGCLAQNVARYKYVAVKRLCAKLKDLGFLDSDVE